MSTCVSSIWKDNIPSVQVKNKQYIQETKDVFIFGSMDSMVATSSTLIIYSIIVAFIGNSGRGM